MKITIECEQKELAELLLAIRQTQNVDLVVSEFTNQLTNALANLSEE